MIREYSVAGWSKYLRALPANMTAAAKRGALSGAMRAVPEVQASTRDAEAVNTGAYLQGWQVKPTDRGALLFNTRSYSGVIEGGRRAGTRQPPRQAIARWAQRRLGLSEQEAKSAAFAIARAIARRGLKGRHVMGGVLERMGRIVREEVAREIRKVIEGGAR